MKIFAEMIAKDRDRPVRKWVTTSSSKAIVRPAGFLGEEHRRNSKAGT